MKFAQALEARPATLFLLLAAIFILSVLGHSLDRPLWHDELFTFYISQARDLSRLLLETRLIDLNPPLSYLLTRIGFHLFGINTLTTRLPEMAGFLLAMLSLFLFVKRRMGTLYGLLAATLFFTGAAGELTIEARPYGLLLGFSCLSLLAWQKAREHKRFGLPLMLLGGFGMLLSHVFGILVWAVLAATEAARILRRRRIEWPLAVAWSVPLISVATYLPLLRTHSAGIFPASFMPNAKSIIMFYEGRMEPEVVCLLLTAIIMLALVGRHALRLEPGWFFSSSELVSMVLLITLPVLLIADLRHSHAVFYPRYASFGSIGVTLLAVIVLARWTAKDPRAAIVCIFFALITAGQLRLSGELLSAVQAVRHHRIWSSTEPFVEPCQTCELIDRLDPSIPLVDASGLTFLEMDHRESASTLSKVYYLTDPAASTSFAHANIFEGMAIERTLFPMRANVRAYPEFVRTHRRFFVLGDYNYPEDWLLRKLQADGANLRLLGPTTNSYKDKDLWLITF